MLRFWQGRAALAVGMLVGCLATARLLWSQEPQPQSPADTTASDNDVTTVRGPIVPTSEQLEAWKKQFPYESLRERLAYEKQFREAPAPTLSDEAETLMKNREEVSFRLLAGSVRGRTLELLHTDKLAEFMSRPGQGFSRMPSVGPYFLRPDESQPQLVDQLKPLSTEYVSEAVVALPSDNPTATANPWRLPTRQQVVDAHQAGQDSFASNYSFGYAKSIEQVAGFLPHRFDDKEGVGLHLRFISDKSRGSADQPGDHPDWKVTRLELMSLLKHDTPAVYLSEHLPRMDELKDAKTRTLTEFEKTGLDKLVAGEELFVESHGNTIEMVGAIRCVEQCRQCHEVKRGTLLGAFSYHLQRDPPVLPAELPKTD